jgi:hypothetical protein
MSPERADQHVHVDGRRQAAESAARVAAVQDAGRDRDRGGVQLGERRRLGDELAMVNVLDGDKADEVGMRLVVVERQLGQRANGGHRIQVVDVQLPFRVPGGGIGPLEHRDVQLFLAGEVVVNHPLGRAGARGDLIDPRP